LTEGKEKSNHENTPVKFALHFTGMAKLGKHEKEKIEKIL